MEGISGYEENDDSDNSDQSTTGIMYKMSDDIPCYIQDGDICLNSEEERLKYMEEQQELLNTSLSALTSHFAQVQFRLRQIVDAPPNEKEGLLKELEEFAFRGIPEFHSSNKHISEIVTVDQEELEEKISTQRLKQRELIAKLKSQLEDVEKYAYETGEAGLPQSIVIERQKVIIDQLKGKLNLNIDHIDKLTVEDIKKHVDNAIGQLVNPMKMKEQLVHQLKTQISDLERFIEFLQGGSAPGDVSKTKTKECTCKCPIHRPTFRYKLTGSVSSVSGQQRSPDEEGLSQFINYLCENYQNMDFANGENNSPNEYQVCSCVSDYVKIRTKTLNIMKRVIAILHIFAGSQFGCDGEKFSKNSLKKNMKVNHWGDLRADLEIAINEVIQLAKEPEAPVDSDYMSDSEGVTSVQCNGKLASAVRKHLAIGIQKLMQHGLMPVGQSVSVVPFMGCFPQRSSSSNNMHAWELILKFYDLKNGQQFNSTPARKLSQSFNLDINGGSAVSSKQNLLGVIGNIIATHSVYKRSYDSHFKAFICAGLNSKMLVIWLRLILRCQPLIELYYQPWSYISKSGFEDSLASLEKLNQFHFDLPVDLAIRQLQNIKDAF